MFKSKKKLFGENIDCNCEYCDNFIFEGEEYICKQGQEIDEEGCCKKFIYDPLRREPRKRPKLPEYDPEEFSL